MNIIYHKHTEALQIGGISPDAFPTFLELEKASKPNEEKKRKIRVEEDQHFSVSE